MQAARHEMFAVVTSSAVDRPMTSVSAVASPRSRGTRVTTTVDGLLAALATHGISRICLSASGSPYKLEATLRVDRDCCIEGEADADGKATVVLVGAVALGLLLEARDVLLVVAVVVEVLRRGAIPPEGRGDAARGGLLGRARPHDLRDLRAWRALRIDL